MSTTREPRGGRNLTTQPLSRGRILLATGIPIALSALVLGFVLGITQVGMPVASVISSCFTLASTPSFLLATNFLRREAPRDHLADCDAEAKYEKA